MTPNRKPGTVGRHGFLRNRGTRERREAACDQFNSNGEVRTRAGRQNSKRRHRRGALTRRVFAVDRFGLSQHRARLNLIGAPAVKAWMKGESRSEPANCREIASIVRRSANR